MPDFLTAEEVEPLPKAKTRPHPEPRTDLLVIGAWAVLFAVVAIGRAVRPDVLE